MESIYHKRIQDYYKKSSWLYKLFWYNSNSLGLHLGFWEKDTKSRQEAILNQNKAILELVKIRKADKILDAGCGVGGTAIYLAKQTGAHITGISITEDQIKHAKNNAEKNKVSSLTTFLQMNYEKTTFPSNSFNIIYGVESICYSYPKINFLKEAYRLLMPGGKLIIEDGYSIRKPKDSKEKTILDEFKKGWALKELCLFNDMTKYLSLSGFTKIKEIDKTKEIKKSISYMYNLWRFTIPFSFIISFIPLPFFRIIIQNNKSIKAINELYKEGILGYYIHYAEKPN